MTYVESRQLAYKTINKPEFVGNDDSNINICIASVKASNSSSSVDVMVGEVKENMFQIFSKNFTETSHSDLLALCSYLLTESLCSQASSELSVLCAAHKFGEL